MNPIIAKRKVKNSINIEKDYFIFGLYPSNPSIFTHHCRSKLLDPGEGSFNIRDNAQSEIIISHFQNESNQLTFILFSPTEENPNRVIIQVDDPGSNSLQKEKYMKQLLHIKPIPISLSPEIQSLKIENLKISSFSSKNDTLVLNDIQYQYAIILLKNAMEKQFDNISVHIHKSNFQDICFIPATISHLHFKNQFEGPFLIVSRSENTVKILFDLFKQWTFLKTLVMLGNDGILNILQKYVFPLVPSKIDIVKYQVVLTTQSVFANSQNFFNSLSWNFVIILDNQRTNLQKMQKCAHFGINIKGIFE